MSIFSLAHYNMQHQPTYGLACEPEAAPNYASVQYKDALRAKPPFLLFNCNLQLSSFFGALSDEALALSPRCGPGARKDYAYMFEVSRSYPARSMVSTI